MAYDKVVDSAVLDAGLKQIADAIREKGGTSDNLAFPQAMADAIAAIEAGGGGSAGSITYGTHISASNREEIVIEHGLGQIPKFIIMFQCPTGELTHIYDTFDFMVQSDLYGGVSITKQSSSTTSTAYIKSAKTAEETASKWSSAAGYPSDLFYMVRDNQFRTKRPTKAGIKYIWLATSVDIAGG